MSQPVSDELAAEASPGRAVLWRTLWVGALDTGPKVGIIPLQMATRYDRGRRAEWKLRTALQADGWTVIRAAGSKGLYDLVAFPRSDFANQRVLAIQVKTVARPEASKALLKGFTPVFTVCYETQLWVWHRGTWTTCYCDPSAKVEKTVRVIPRG